MDAADGNRFVHFVTVHRRTMADADDDKPDHGQTADGDKARADREPTPYEMQWPRAPFTWQTYRWWLSKAIENDPVFWPIMIFGAIIFTPMAGWLVIREVIEFLQQF